jgi:hypothetical protein
MESGMTSSGDYTERRLVGLGSSPCVYALHYKDIGLTPYLCCKWFASLASALHAKERLGGTLRGFVDGKWVDIDNS